MLMKSNRWSPARYDFLWVRPVSDQDGVLGSWEEVWVSLLFLTLSSTMQLFQKIIKSQGGWTLRITNRHDFRTAQETNWRAREGWSSTGACGTIIPLFSLLRCGRLGPFPTKQVKKESKSRPVQRLYLRARQKKVAGSRRTLQVGEVVLVKGDEIRGNEWRLARGTKPERLRSALVTGSLAKRRPAVSSETGWLLEADFSHSS